MSISIQSTPLLQPQLRGLAPGFGRRVSAPAVAVEPRRSVLQLSRASASGPLPPLALQLAQPLGSSEIDSLWRAEEAKISHIGPQLTELPDFSVTPLKIALDTEQEQARFSLRSGHLRVHSPSGVVDLGALQGDFEVKAHTGGFELWHQGASLGRFQGHLSVDNQSETLHINGKSYRGDLELRPAPAQPDRLQVINTVLLEDYLRAVVPSESPASWPIESLKAQSLAARTYAVANWGKNKAQGFDMRDDTSDQVYKGLESEHPRTNQAVEATRGRILAYQGRPITALFFSTSGGHTDSSLEVWGTALPYIQPVPDFDQASSRYRWTLKRSAATLSDAARKLGHDLGTLHSIEPLSHTPQGRVKTLRLSGTSGSAVVNANRFRFAARLYSTLWQVERQGQGPSAQFVFKGGGWGHGLGMSQWGARQLAADGWQGDAIARYYYTDVEIIDLPESPTTPESH